MNAKNGKYENFTMPERIQIYKDFMGEFYDKELAQKIYDIGFFTAPAAAKFHSNYAGGLFFHSLEVAQKLVEMTEKMGLEWENARSPYYVGMFHDLCKCQGYVPNEFGGYRTNPNAEPGHGDLSVKILARLGISLTAEEEQCILQHMGPFAYNAKDFRSVQNAYGNAVGEFPNVLWTHTADMFAARVLNI